MLADQQVTIVAAKAEGTDPRHPEAIATPWLERLQQPKGALSQRHVWRLRVQRGWSLPMTQGLDDLDQRRRPGSGDQVPHVGLERAHRDLHAIGIEHGGAADLRGIAHAGARGVKLQQRYLRRTKIGAGISSFHGSPLSLLGGRQKPPSTAIVREPDPADHAIDHVAVLTSVCQPFEGHEAGPLRRNEPVGVGVKGAALPGAAERLKRSKAHMDEQVVRAIDSPSEGHIDAPVMEHVAGQLDRIQRAGAGRVQAKHSGREAQRALQQRGQAP